jgi:uncharacterized membrane protein YfhO
MRFAVGPLARTGLLVVAVSAAPGWRARVDGADAVLVTANAAFMGVVVPPGRRKVDIEYRPSSFALGLYVSLLSLGCLMARLSARPCLRQGTLCGTE